MHCLTCFPSLIKDVTVHFLSDKPCCSPPHQLNYSEFLSFISLLIYSMSLNFKSFGHHAQKAFSWSHVILSLTVKLWLLDQDVSWMLLPLYAQVPLTHLWFLVQTVGVGYRAVYNDYSWLSASLRVQESIEKPEDTNRLRIWLKRTSESYSLSWGSLGHVNIPLKPPFCLERRKK